MGIETPSQKPGTTPEGVAIAVYTQGKVGSKSLAEALGDMHPDVHVWDIRRGLMEGVIEHEKIRGTRPQLLSEDRQFAEYLEAHPDTDMRAVSVVREPVAIAVSSLFYNFIPRNPGVDINDVTDEEFTERLVRGESFSHPSFHLEWFDIEVEPLTGIDVYQAGEFPIDTGYQTYAGDRDGRHTDLLVMRLDDLGRVAHTALTDFFGTEAPAELPRNNTGSGAAYGDRYRAFQQTASLPEEWVLWQLQSQFATHFYSPAELEGFANRWIQ